MIQNFFKKKRLNLYLMNFHGERALKEKCRKKYGQKKIWVYVRPCITVALYLS
jgi:hypothetical protein